MICEGKGNYGCWGLIDFIAGTSVGTEILDDMEKDVDSVDMDGVASKTKGGQKRKASGAKTKGGKVNGKGKAKVGTRRRKKSDQDSDD